LRTAKRRAQQAGQRTAARERDEFLTVEEVCEELKISRRTFDRWRALGTGPRSERLGGAGPVRVRRSWLDEWLGTSKQVSA
jgi:excisionase family DNA binding protein